jgi:predicted nucleic acid-binding protein
VSVRQILVIDASVAIKWYVPEDRSSEAVAVLSSGADLLAPELLVAELGNIVWKKRRRGELTLDEATTIVQAFVTACPVELRPTFPNLDHAFRIAAAFNRTVYDSLYLALAVTEHCPLLTADEHLYHALQGSALQPYCTML